MLGGYAKFKLGVKIAPSGLEVTARLRGAVTVNVVKST